MRPLTRTSLGLLYATLCAAALALGGLASTSLACFMASPDDTRQLSIRIAPDTDRLIQTSLWKNGDDEDGCTASVQVELSAFPSASLATRPSEVAAAIREVADEWRVERCTVYVTYENDTRDEIVDHELCLIGEFRFDQGDFWSAGSEGFCWEPSNVEVVLDAFEESDFPG